MGEIVFAAAMSHAPGITAFADAAPQLQKQRVYSALEELGRQLKTCAPDVLLVVASDHFTNFSMAHMSAFCIGTADHYLGPVEDWINIDRIQVPGARAYATALLDEAYANDFDVSFSADMPLEHGVMVPLKFLTSSMDVPIVPLLQNCAVPPLPSLRRCIKLGEVMSKAARRGKERLAVIGTGGLSHAPGAPEAGRIDTAFDTAFLALLQEGNVEALANLSDADVDAAGFGAWEVRPWITVASMVRGRKADVLAYEAVKEWDTGCGVVIFE
jgi:aromatic ring-opening dioxygenase catalytic subunit (LigB family)